jgi:hypothetical protein
VEFALSKGGEALGLFAADGTAIDAITFGPQTTDVTEGRFPDGAANVYVMPTPTPRAANIGPDLGPGPEVFGPSVSGNEFVFFWQTIAGQNVQVESCDDLAAPVWEPASGIIIGTGGIQSFTNLLAPTPHRYFRLSVVGP